MTEYIGRHIGDRFNAQKNRLGNAGAQKTAQVLVRFMPAMSLTTTVENCALGKANTKTT